MARVVVGDHQVLDDIHPPHGAAIRQVCKYPVLDGAVEPLHHGCLLFALTCDVLDTMALHQARELRIEELLALVGL